MYIEHADGFVVAPIGKIGIPHLAAIHHRHDAFAAHLEFAVAEDDRGPLIDAEAQYLRVMRPPLSTLGITPRSAWSAARSLTATS